jgi:two-component system sensor histidine kinase/response regulator
LTPSNEFFHHLIHNLQDAFACVNMDGKIVDCNIHFCNLVGHTKPDLLGLNFTSLTPSVWHPSEQKIIEEQVLVHGFSEVYEKEYIHKSGTTFPVELRTVLLRNTHNEPEFMWAIVRDITERKLGETTLLQAKHTAECANHAKGAFLAQVSHEIRTVLSGLTCAHELLALTKLNKKQVSLLKTAVHSLECLVSLMNGILDLSKIEAGMLRLSHEKFNLAHLLQDVSESHKPKIMCKQVELKMDVAESLNRSFWGDPLRIKQVLNNLLDNAAKFTSEGTIILAADTTDYEPSTNTLTAHISVTDTGVGIDPNKINLIFAPFTQAEQNTCARLGGTGLGLTICKQIVQLWGGQIWVESSLGEGSAFHFTAKFKNPQH